MSRNFRMSVEITGASLHRFEAIKTAASGEWDFDDWHARLRESAATSYLQAWGEGRLCGGEADDAFAERLTRVIWAANQGFCHVEVTSVYLDELPSETFTFDREWYDHLLKKKEKP